jgi:hypothetical protein
MSIFPSHLLFLHEMNVTKIPNFVLDRIGCCQLGFWIIFQSFIPLILCGFALFFFLIKNSKLPTKVRKHTKTTVFNFHVNRQHQLNMFCISHCSYHISKALKNSIDIHAMTDFHSTILSGFCAVGIDSTRSSSCLLIKINKKFNWNWTVDSIPTFTMSQ